MQNNWPETHRVYLAPDCPVDLPLLDIGDGFRIYSFDMTGEAAWNRRSAPIIPSISSCARAARAS